MGRALSYAILVVFAAASVAVIAARAEWLGDANGFLKNFVNHEFLNLLGVILAITLASVANIHLEFNKIEERYQREGLGQSRRNLHKNTRWLIGLFCVAVVIVTVKPLLGDTQTASAFANMAAMLILLWHILLLVSLTNLVFSIPADIKKGEAPPPRSPPGTGRGKRR